MHAEGQTTILNTKLITTRIMTLNILQSRVSLSNRMMDVLHYTTTRGQRSESNPWGEVVQGDAGSNFRLYNNDASY